MYSRTLAVLTLTAIAAVSLLAGSILTSFTAFPKDNGIMLEWESQEEIDLLEYRIERGVNGGNYSNVGITKSTGSQSQYSYFDESVFAKIANRSYTYRLKMVDNNGSFTFSKEITVSPTLSAARETWGSIKALFR